MLELPAMGGAEPPAMARSSQRPLRDPAPTLRDVASLAEVSISTASRVLTKAGFGSTGVRLRVLDAARNLGYVPSLHARALRASRSMIVGVMVSTLDNPTYTHYVRGAEHVAEEEGYDLILCDAQASEEIQRRQLDRLLGHRVDGLLVVPPGLSFDGFRTFIKSGIPILPAESLDYHLRLKSVVEAVFPALLAAMRSLRQAGHERIAMVTRTPELVPHAGMPSLTEVILGRLADHGVVIDPRLVLRVNSVEGCRAVVQRLQSEGSAPTAYLVDSYELTPRMLLGIVQSGLAIPDDVSFVSHGESDWALAYRPELSVIKRDYYRQGAEWMRRLVQGMNGEVPDAPTPNLPYEFVLRGSIGPPPAS